VADSALSSGDSASPHVIRCAECHELVPAERVRHREERIKVAAKPAPGQWRAGGPPIFRPTARGPAIHGPRMAPGGRPGAQAPPPPPRSAYSVERIPVCIDCLHRQRMGLYGVCGIAAACLLVAVALYSHEESQPSSQEVALLSSSQPTGATRSTEPTATPQPEIVASAPPPSTVNDAGDARPIWQPIWEAAKSMLSSASTNAPPNAAPAPEQVAAPAIASASAPATTAGSPPMTASATTPTPPAPSATGSAPATPAPPTDVADAPPTAPPIWQTEHKPPRKVARGTPAPRGEGVGANALALRNNGYAALSQRRYGEALTLLQQATMMGDAYAPMYIGQIFENGIGVPRDVGQASYWYGIAINRGNAAALAAFNRMRVNPY